ncbi:MAG: phosphoglycerate dehydrogenase [Thermodesulfobacteriota bacterium]
MKVLVSDNLGEAGIQILRAEKDIQVDVKTGLPPEELKKIIGEYDALIVRSATKVTGEIINAGTRLKVVGRAGIGLDNVDVPAATKRGIVVMNTPTGNIVTTAEHAIAMMLSLSRNIPQGTSTLKSGMWEKKKLQGREIFNKTLGLIGYGKIGSIVADRARGLKMQVIVYDPFVTPERIREDGFESVTLEALYERSDYITVHVPKMKGTAGLLNKAAFDKMKKGVMIINCARGGIVNEQDLHDAIKAGKVAGAALDVFETEPPGKTPLLELANVIGTPHLGASTAEAQTNVAIDVVRQIIGFLKHNTIVNAVNAPSVSGEILNRLGPFIILAEKMGRLQSQLSCGPLKEVAVTFNGDFGGMDLSPVTTAALKGILMPIVKDEVNFVNAPELAKGMGIKITESMSPEAGDYTQLVTLRSEAREMTTVISGTIFGKKEMRVVKINDFRLELVPEGYMVLIYNQDKPGAIGSIGSTLGKHQINISRMQVGQDQEKKKNVIFLKTDTLVPESVLQELKALPLVESVIPLTFGEDAVQTCAFGAKS